MGEAPIDAMRRAEEDDTTSLDVDEHEPATPPRHAPPRPARRAGRPGHGR